MYPRLEYLNGERLRDLTVTVLRHARAGERVTLSVTVSGTYSSILTNTLGLEKILMACSISVSFRSSSDFLVFTRSVSTRTGRPFNSVKSWS